MMNGKIIYQGYACLISDHFKKLGAPCPANYNPSDFFMREFSINEPLTNADKEKIERFNAGYSQYLEQSVADSIKALDYGSFDISKRTTASFGTQFKELLVRAFRGTNRNPMAARARMGQSIVMGVMVCLVFSQINGTDFKSRMNVTGASFFITVFLLMTSMMGTVLVFQGERPVYLREYASQLYGVPAYFNARTIAELPPACIGPFLFCSITYFAIGFTGTAAQFFTYYLIAWSMSQVGMSIGYALSSIFTNVTTAAMLAPILMMPLMVLSGFYLNMDTMPGWLNTLTYLNPLRYCLEAFVSNEFDPIHDGEFDILTQLDMSLGLWTCIFVLLGMILLLRVVALIGLKLLT